MTPVIMKKSDFEYRDEILFVALFGDFLFYDSDAKSKVNNFESNPVPP